MQATVVNKLTHHSDIGIHDGVRRRGGLRLRPYPTSPSCEDLVLESASNRAIEDVAIEWVMELERRHGRAPKDTRHARSAADIESPPRVIEVKAYGTSSRGSDLWLEVRQVDEARRNPNFYVYVVENVRQGRRDYFRLKVLGGERLARLLDRATEQRYYSVPWPVADYDSCPTTLDD